MSLLQFSTRTRLNIYRHPISNFTANQRLCTASWQQQVHLHQRQPSLPQPSKWKRRPSGFSSSREHRTCSQALPSLSAPLRLLFDLLPNFIRKSFLSSTQVNPQHIFIIDKKNKGCAMEVDKLSFYPQILDILTDISESHFVAIDLELSGVPSKVPRKGPGKQTLQDRYVETKEAAERYQILQFGLTCVRQDVANQKYILKPYNFDLSPIIEERGLDIERIFSFQSGAAEFLLRTGFDIGRPFHSGVPYLSRAESREARRKFSQRQDKSAVADIQIKPTETESLAFVEKVRQTVSTWLHSTDPAVEETLTITADSAEDVIDGTTPAELSRFEKRLVHQLVRAEYPELVTFSKRGAISIVRFDKEREDKHAAERKRELNERINRQKGLRWVIEALLGSDLSHLDLRECAKDPETGAHVFADLHDFRAQFNRAHEIIRGHPRVLVGHNCFLDLVYVYRTFIGDLPDTVAEFQNKLHALWPTVVDTKYLSTHNCGDINPVSALDQIAAQLSMQETPEVELHEQHDKYATYEAFHEAGFDSYLTAQIAVRLSSKLETEGAYLDETTAKLNNGVAALSVTAPSSGAELAHLDGTDQSTESKAADFVPSEVGGKWTRQGDPTVETRSLTRAQANNAPQTFKGGMPTFDSDFWHVYGNKLRIFGTEESVCVLNSKPEEVDSEPEEVGAGGVSI